MNLAILVEVDGGALRPVMLDVDDETPGSALLDALLAHLQITNRVSGWIRRSGAGLDTESTVSGMALRDGDVVVLGSIAESVQAPVSPSRTAGAHLELVVVGGPADKQTYPLQDGSLALGRDPESAVAIVGDATVSWKHATLKVSQSGLVLSDAGSTNGTWLEGRSVIAEAPCSPGQVIELGDTLLTVRVVGSPEEGATVWRSGTLAFNRPPRVNRPPTQASFKAPTPPTQSTKQKIPLAASLVPLLLGGVMAILLHNPTYLVFCLIGPLMAVTTLVSNRRSGRAGLRSEQEKFETALEKVGDDIAAAHGAEVAARRAAAPDPTRLLERAQDRTSDLWERRATDPDFIDLRVGVADRPSDLSIELPRDGDDAMRTRAKALADQFAIVPSVPVSVNLRTNPVTGIVGASDAVNDLVRWLVLQASVLCSPAELAIVAFVPPDTAEAWSWLSWLPHTSTLAAELTDVVTTGDGGRSVASGATAAAMFQRLETLVAARLGNDNSGLVAPRVTPHILVVTPGVAPVAMPRWHALLDGGPRAGVSVLCAAGTPEELPGPCRVIVRTSMRAEDVSVTLADPGEVLDGLIGDSVSEEACRSAALSLAPLRDAGASGRGGGVPARVLLTELPSMDRIDAPAIGQSWAESRDVTLSAPIGMSAAGPHWVSIRNDGPHALVAGTPGSGKSELLQTFVLSLALQHPPNRLSFVLFDFKGEAAFGPLLQIPHVLDVLSDLTPALTARALASLRAESARREALFGEYRVKDLEELERLHPEIAPPAMLIVFDEFNLLKDSMPDFLNGIADLLRRGRSLGMHVVLVTQSPEGVIDRGMRANIKLKVALATVNAAESASILDRPDAAAPGSPKGRAWVQLGTGEPTVVQTAYTSAPLDGSVRAARVAPFELSGARWPRVEEETERARQRPHTLADELMTSIASAARAARWERLPSPSRPPLHDHYSLEDLLARTPAPEPGSLSTPIGLNDDPTHQRQEMLFADLAESGHLLVYGTGGSGTTTLLRTMAYGLASRYDADRCQLYAIDFGARLLGPLEALPSCGAVIPGDDLERIERLFAMLTSAIASRKELLGREQAATLAELHARGHSSPVPPHLVVLLDGYQAFHAAYCDVDRGEFVERFASFVADGRAVGVHFAISADRTRGIPNQLSTAISARVVLRLAEPDEYLWLGVPQARSMSFVPGRGIDGTGLECQIAAAGAAPTNDEQVAALATLAARLPPEPAAPALVRAPELVVVDELPSSTQAAIPLGIDAISLAPVALDLDDRHIFVVAGPERSGRSTALTTLAVGWASAHPDAEIFLIAPARSPLRDSPTLKWAQIATTPEAAAEMARDLTRRVVAEADTSGAPILVVIDDAERLTDPSVSAAFDPFVRRVRDADVALLVGVAVRVAARTFSGWLREVRETKHGMLLAPDPDLDNEVFSTRLPRKATRRFAPGRGYLIDRDRVVYVQVAMVALRTGSS